ncbi:MAG: FtsX-like permease family protein [Candidatus Blackburnbacteria bacterium]|nr:FtsX-like permease family protein [Candidatus Blackburnbacteria bacterium]
MHTAWKHIRRSPYQALTAVFIMTLTFFVATVLVVLAYGTSTVLRYYETRPQVIAYLKADVTPSDVSSLQVKLESDSRVEGVKYVSKEQALDIYKQATSSNPLLAEFVSPKIFPASLEFSVRDLAFAQEVISQLGEEATIEEVAFTANLGDSKNLNQVVERLSSVANYVRIGGAVVLGFLLASSFLVLLIIIGMRISSRREEIEILQLIGATSGFIRSPFILEGMFYVVVGSVVGWLLTLLLTLYVSPSLISFFQGVPFLPQDLFSLLELFGVVLAGEFLLAIILGALGSLIAIKRYLKI